LIGTGTARHERDRFDPAQASVEAMKTVLRAAGYPAKVVAAAS
jgi:hypothetical protein